MLCSKTYRPPQALRYAITRRTGAVVSLPEGTTLLHGYKPSAMDITGHFRHASGLALAVAIPGSRPCFRYHFADVGLAINVHPRRRRIGVVAEILTYSRRQSKTTQAGDVVQLHKRMGPGVAEKAFSRPSVREIGMHGHPQLLGPEYRAPPRAKSSRSLEQPQILRRICVSCAENPPLTLVFLYNGTPPDLRSSRSARCSYRPLPR